MSASKTYVVAHFDQALTERLQALEDKIRPHQDSRTQTTGIPWHLTVATLDGTVSQEAVSRLRLLAEKTKPIRLTFSHIGLFGFDVLFVAPTMSQALFDLRLGVYRILPLSDPDWVAHVTLLYRRPEATTQAIREISPSLPITGWIRSLTLYQYPPSKVIAHFELID